jgi:hypothetical protein
MDDAQFRSWMRRMAAVDEGAHPASANAIWWRAQLRRRQDIEERARRPIRIAEGAGGLLCWILAATLSVGMGTVGPVVLLALTLAIVGGLRAIAIKKI